MRNEIASISMQNDIHGFDTFFHELLEEQSEQPRRPPGTLAFLWTMIEESKESSDFRMTIKPGEMQPYLPKGVEHK